MRFNLILLSSCVQSKEDKELALLKAKNTILKDYIESEKI